MHSRVDINSNYLLNVALINELVSCFYDLATSWGDIKVNLENFLSPNIV